MKPVSLLLILAALLVGSIAWAQTNETGSENPGQVVQPIATLVVTPVAVPTAVPPVTQAPPAAPAINSEILRILINARTDLEVLANQALGNGQRPAGWSGSLDVNNPQLAILIRLDLELLLAASLGLGNIPPEWFGANPGTHYTIARDIRHDLELLADSTGQPNARPPGWAGDDPIMRCDRSTQNLALLLERDGLFIPNVDPVNPDFCRLVSRQIGQYTVGNLLTRNTSLAPQQPAPVTTNEQGETIPAPVASSGTVYTRENVGIAFLDRYATQRVGTIPSSVRLTPVARSFVQFSHMTLVRGDNFEVFVDYATTTLSERDFSVLPNVNNVGINTFCNADWCRPVVILPGMGSGRRSGRLAAVGLINAGSNMVIHYDGEDHNGMTKVRMELCDRPTSTNQAICEPATEVILPDGSPAPAVGSLGGLAQFYVPYSYTTTSVRSRNFFTVDLWIDPPEARR